VAAGSRTAKNALTSPVPTRVVNLRLRELDLKRIDAIAKREGCAGANLLQSWVFEALKNARSTK
jgi:hypothetical protein